MGPPSSSIYSILADDVDEKTCAADDETCRHLLEEEETEEDSEKCADHYDDCELWANQEDECVNNAECKFFPQMPNRDVECRAYRLSLTTSIDAVDQIPQSCT